MTCALCENGPALLSQVPCSAHSRLWLTSTSPPYSSAQVHWKSLHTPSPLHRTNFKGIALAVLRCVASVMVVFVRQWSSSTTAGWRGTPWERGHLGDAGRIQPCYPGALALETTLKYNHGCLMGDYSVQGNGGQLLLLETTTDPRRQIHA